MGYKSFAMLEVKEFIKFLVQLYFFFFVVVHSNEKNVSNLIIFDSTRKKNMKVFVELAK
jgi:hypothetical protein